MFWASLPYYVSLVNFDNPICATLHICHQIWSNFEVLLPVKRQFGGQNCARRKQNWIPSIFFRILKWLSHILYGRISFPIPEEENNWFQVKEQNKKTTRNQMPSICFEFLTWLRIYFAHCEKVFWAICGSFPIQRRKQLNSHGTK